MARKIYNLIILDKSGSMSSIRNEAVAGVNETIGTIKAFVKNNPDSEQYISLVAFCNCGTDYLLKYAPATSAEPINQRDYNPCCGTPLYDTIGKSCSQLHEMIKNESDVAVSVTIITDGYENSSREWTHQAVKSLIEQYKQEGWLFAYIGADHDVEQVSFSLSITNHMTFDKSLEGTQTMYARERRARDRWMTKLHNCVGATLTECNDNYFDDDDVL